MNTSEHVKSNITTENILRWGIYLVALVPLIIFKDFLSPFHFGKVVVFRTLIEILGIFYVALILKDRRFLPKMNMVFWSVTVFTGVFLLTSLTGVYPYQSIFGTLERMGGALSFVHFWLFFVISVSILRTKEQWLMFIKVAVWASLISAVYGFLQRTNLDFIVASGGRLRIFGTVGNPALFAGYMLVSAFFALLLAFRSKSDRWRLLYGSIFIIDIVALFFTAVRGSILAVFASLAFFAFIYVRSQGLKKLGKVFITAVLVLVLLEVLLIASHDTAFVQKSGYLSRLSDASLSTRTVDTRLWAWRAGLDGWDDSLKTIILGWGPENFNVPFSIHFNPQFFDKPGAETLFDRAHNMFVEVLVTMGIIGFFAYILIFVALFAYLRRIKRAVISKEDKMTVMVLEAGLVAYMVHNFFFFDTSSNFIVFFILMGFVYHLHRECLSKPEENLLQRVNYNKTLRLSMIFLSVILAVMLSYFTALKPVFANYTTTRAIVSSWQGKHKEAIEGFEKALSYRTFASYEILNSRNRYAQYVINNASLMQKEGIDVVQVLGSVIKYEQEFTKKNPLDYLPYLYISRAYILIGASDPKSKANDLALEASMAALKISPTFVRTYFEIAQAYLNKKDYDTAIGYFKQAVDLNPGVGISWWYLGLSKIENGDVEGGLKNVETAFEKNYNPSENDMLRLAHIYASRGEFNKVVELYQKILKLNPKNPQHFASLAVSYVQIGEIDKALEVLREGLKLHPDFKQQFEDYARSIGRTL